MHRTAPTPTTTATRRASRRRAWAAPMVAALVVLGAAACSSTPTVETGGASGSGSGSGASSDPGSSASPTTLPAAADAPSDVVDPAPPRADASPPTTCVEGPATTIPGDPGGGRITCSAADPDGSVSSPPMTDTTIFRPSTSIVPSADHGALVVSATGGYDCGDDPCPAIGIIMSGTISVVGPDGVPADNQLDGAGLAGFRLTPGTYQVTAEVGPGSCQAGTATVTAGVVTDLSLLCSVPMP